MFRILGLKQINAYYVYMYLDIDLAILGIDLKSTLKYKIFMVKINIFGCNFF